METAVVVGLVIAGVAAHRRRWLWALIAVFAVGVAAWNWSRGAYSDSGNEVGFSLLVVALVALPALMGAGAHLLLRRITSRPT